MRTVNLDVERWISSRRDFATEPAMNSLVHICVSLPLSGDPIVAPSYRHYE